METDHFITSIIFEHACKKEFTGVLQNVFEDKDIVSKVLQNSNCSEYKSTDKPKINPLFILVNLLKKLHSFKNFTEISKNTSGVNVLTTIIELLEAIYRQYNFISLKKYFTLISELRLLDLLSLIVNDCESSDVVQKLNQHFPRWTANYRTSLEKNFLIENTKVLDKVEESHTQCRRLVLKLAVDKTYRMKYMSEQYSNDLDRLTKESKVYINDTILALELHAGCSVLEKVATGKEKDCSYMNDLSIQLLLDYIQPEITDKALLEFLDDHEPILNSQQPTAGLSSCLLPIDTMSEISDDEDNCEDSGESESDSESWKDDEGPVKSFVDVLPSSTSNSDVLMDLDKNDDKT